MFLEIHKILQNVIEKYTFILSIDLKSDVGA